ncbi:beta-ketoacyl-[acyl-carrier-protein] synthase family protein [Candidatus Magnetominusculus dajiuhuensis]|uniref:beta-ketoacyl-[acyl-carrier-protein] synthase family protein n=1 Tax=Candidatus Magnetominusculus dajiuhuensis TaxID=3137712 RepID=UPI003B4316B8
MNRVVITGIGAVTPLGNSFSESWSGLIEGRSGIRPLPARLRRGGVTQGGQLIGFDAGQFLGVREINRLDPFVHYAVAAAAMALDDSALDDKQPSGFASIIGTSRGGITTINDAAVRLAAHENGRLRGAAYLMPATTASMAASYISQKFGLAGHTLGISNACTSGANAVGEAFRLIKHGYAEGAVAGGAEAPLCALCIAGYGASGALSKSASLSASRPFCTGRDGFVLAEGACVVVMEGYKRALSRGARIYAEVLGYGNTSDGLDMVRPDSAMQAAAMRNALAEAAIGPEDIDFINAHATSTPLGDAVESEAIHKAFKDRAARLPVTANKSMTGHMLSASAAFETAVTAMSIYTGLIPPTINIKSVDPACRLNVISKILKINGIAAGVTSSFGFGGVNASIVLGVVPCY